MTNSTFSLFSTVYNIFIDRLYPLDCLHTLPLDNPKKYIERMLFYVYFINKIIDLLDTIFFVLRKSYKQITFLHVFHHSYMVSSIYWLVRFYGCGGQFLTVALANTFIHTVMYFYYMISAIYTGLKASLWWKKHITEIQIIQFIIMMLHSVFILIFNPECEFPVACHFLIITLDVIFMTLFSHFYINAYIKPHKKSNNKQEKNQ